MHGGQIEGETHVDAHHTRTDSSGVVSSEKIHSNDAWGVESAPKLDRDLRRLGGQHAQAKSVAALRQFGFQIKLFSVTQSTISDRALRWNRQDQK